MSEEIETVGKVADATKEVAKATGKGIDALSDAGGFLKDVFGDIVVDSVGLLRDRLRYYRLEQAAVLIENTNKRLQARGVQRTRLVSPRVALPIFEEATIETDTDLKQRWASLLASAMDASGHEITRRYVSVLTDMTAAEAKLFQYIISYFNAAFDWELQKHAGEDLFYPGSEYCPIPVAGLLGISAEEFEDAMRNFMRLGLVAPGSEHAADALASHDEFNPKEGIYRRSVAALQDITRLAQITPFGFKFARAIELEIVPPEIFSDLL